MATKYAIQQQGVADGTVVPADKADGRQVNARRRCIIASKEPGVAWNSGDKIYLGKLRPGEKPVDFKVCTDTSFGTSTIDIGDGTTVDKWVDGATNTTTDKMVSIGPKAATLDDDPPDGETELWATIGVANIAAATVASIVIETCGQ